MTELPFPNSLADLDQWGERLGLPSHEARERFVECVVFDCIANLGLLGLGLVLKGGNALRFFHSGMRSTLDLDFTVDGGIVKYR